MKVFITKANVQDGDGAILLLDECVGKFPRMTLIMADSAYNREKLNDWIAHFGSWKLAHLKKAL